MLPLLLAAVLVADPAPAVPEIAALNRKAEAVRPNGTDFRWQQIPWFTDAASARAQAKLEARPMLVWVAGGRDRDGTPLERC